MSTGTPQTGNASHLLRGMELRIIFAFVLIASGAFALVFQAAYADVIPVPQKKPAQQIRAVPTENLKQASDNADVTFDATGLFDQCVQLLNRNGSTLERAEPFETEDGCGIADPVAISAIQTDTSSIKLHGNPLLSCQFAARLVTWIKDVVAPIAYKHNNSELAQISSGPGYVCKKRNNGSSGKFSEHAFGNAIDINGLVFSNGERVGIANASSGTAAEMGMLQALRMTSCGYFTTVLGPGTNEAHKDHFHLDYGKHGRTWNYRICE